MPNPLAANDAPVWSCRRTFPVKIQFFQACKALGLFHLSRFLMRRRLLILCFHGIALNDEARFRPKLFMRESLFRQRLETIQRYRFPVLPLSEALEGLDQDSMPDNSVAITIDDGFYNALVKAAPLLAQYNLPATLYLTSYYAEKRTPIFRLVVQYMFWKTTASKLDLFDQDWGPDQIVSLDDESARNEVAWQIIEYGERHCDEPGRQAICQTLGAMLQVDYGEIVESRILSLVTPQELASLQESDIDIQLHTHRHRLPVNDKECRREIRENKHFLRQALGEDKEHLCYPSGEWSTSQWACLTSEGIKSATTCEAGLNTAKTPRLALYRILDEDNLSQIEFEAELFGFSELLRILSGKHRGR